MFVKLVRYAAFALLFSLDLSIAYAPQLGYALLASGEAERSRLGTAILTPVTFGLNNTPEITAFLFSEVLCGETISLTPASVILYALLLPFVTLTAVCMLQTLLNLVARPAISFLICFVTYIAAAYFPIEWLVGNGAMVMRYQLFDANGLSYRKELVFTLLLLLLSIGAGYLLIQRKDLISLEK